MLKREELSDPNSCINRAKDGEMVFVLLARDPAATATILAWIQERVRLGKSGMWDEEIADAFECAKVMQVQRLEGTWKKD